jgi:co-chaperonin GroES (HSP10)
MKDRSAKGLSITKGSFHGNTTGWTALDYKVFVKKDKVEEKTVGGIVLTRDLADQEEWTVSTGVLIDHGHLAFTEGYKNGELVEWDRKPKPGDRVMIKEYAGMRFVGEDDERYLVITDKDIVGMANE